MRNNAIATYQTPADFQHIGWDPNESYATLFNRENVLAYQKRITELLQGVEPSNRPIIVPVETIVNVLYQCYMSNKPRTGDIYSRYIQAENVFERDDLTEIVNRAINIIVTHIQTDYGMRQCNNKLTVWNSVLGDFNREGLRGHDIIKVRKRGPERMQFHMNY